MILPVAQHDQAAPLPFDSGGDGDRDGSPQNPRCDPAMLADLIPIFEMVDIDGTGWIDLGELQQAFAQGLGAGEQGYLSVEDAAAGLRMRDDDNDGKLSLPEFGCDL